MNEIILSIAIPTYNRANWLKLCLDELLPQVIAVGNNVDVTVYDNASPDNTAEVVQTYLDSGLSLNYVRNAENIGSDRNIAQCFNFAKGRYVLILGDDDVVLEGALRKLTDLLSAGNYGAVFISAYGYNNNFKKEKPKQSVVKPLAFESNNAFVEKCATNAAFISSLVINRNSMMGIDANQFVGTALVQTYLFYEAISRNSNTLYVNEYLVAAKRIESRDYNVINIFTIEFNNALQYLMLKGLDKATINRINRKLLWYFLPIHLINLRKTQKKVGTEASFIALHQLYKHEILFWICCMPILKFPKWIACFWGYALLALGRVSNGEFGRLWVAFREVTLNAKSKLF
ncbi:MULTISPECIES: glycosyltransferase family 2 protein [Methylotenera]|uniref:glycosyltransferase family 2 protein n=1 Tax=Methylotenera TaxID=359407 RepID=UPI00037D1FBD|nr:MULTISPECIES: glycosyltransferase family 2 protein [Methylotenera]